MRNIIAITLIALGAYFVYDAGKTIYNGNETIDGLEYSSDGEYQEIVAYKDEARYKSTQTYTFLITGVVLIICGFLLYFLKRKH